MRFDGTIVIPGLYAFVLQLWLALSAWTAKRAAPWAFTPRWHRAVVPVFRALFLFSLPLEFLLAEREFLPHLFFLGGLATLGWLAWRFAYLLRAPPALPAEDSVRVNLGYITGLIAFALACHSYVCLAVMINVSVPLLLVRERWQRHRLHAVAAGSDG